ncbi:hypothetical protein LEP1GSC060_3118 [Leptospira weilii serovar Ranarum str. ICFT]|uniref:Uncharacterized protein n=1 Tax=Leptospira weilii serovar Ranarum str. ICFT TaxID=1218598 RepID=N1WI41_9LEPT|nr:hypothetical protein LEP1GSC060_3118 [Leptospira weilii serovar Ranarum str. ICFT]
MKNKGFFWESLTRDTINKIHIVLPLLWKYLFTIHRLCSNRKERASISYVHKSTYRNVVF